MTINQRFSMSLPVRLLDSVSCLVLTWIDLGAFPPAPPNTAYSLVRGEFGFGLDDGETDLALPADDVELPLADINSHALVVPEGGGLARIAFTLGVN
jgi:hypothetical protein